LGDATFATAACTVADSADPTVALTSTSTTQTGAVIVFQSSETGTAYVKYGLNTAYGYTTEIVNVTAATDATTTLAGLTCGLTYHYSIYAKDAALNEANNLGDATFATAACDAGAPTISSVVAGSITSATATISWVTDATSTDNIVEYGTTSALGTSSAADANALSHSRTLSGLTANQQYWYQVKSTVGTSTARSSLLSFTTLASGNGTLAVTGTAVTRSTMTAGGTYNNGGSWTLDITVPANEPSLTLAFGDWVGSSDTLATAGNMRVYSAQSSNATSTSSVITIDAADTASDPLTITGDLNSTTPGYQIQVVVDFKVPDGAAGGSYGTSYELVSSGS
jgi:hypothetical protein